MAQTISLKPYVTNGATLCSYPQRGRITSFHSNFTRVHQQITHHPHIVVRAYPFFQVIQRSDIRKADLLRRKTAGDFICGVNSVVAAWRYHRRFQTADNVAIRCGKCRARLQKNQAASRDAIQPCRSVSNWRISGSPSCARTPSW